jgi:hypothetical protein
MRKVWIGSVIILCGLMLWMADGSIVLADDPTPSLTPTSTAAFVLPFINVPIVLPTAFMPPFPTAITVNVTAAPNMNPLGLQIPGNPVWAWNEGLNWMQGIFKVMGWMGNLLFFVFIVLMALALINTIRNRVMGVNAQIETPRFGFRRPRREK